MSVTFKPRQLFGGCIEADLPSTFLDASDIRQIPDSQEVFLDPEGFTNIIIEPLERVTGFESDREAVDFILQDILEADDIIKVWNVSKSTLPKLGIAVPVIVALGEISHDKSIPRREGQDDKFEVVGIIMIIVRLEEQQTDLVVTVNIPHTPGAYQEFGIDVPNGKYGPLLSQGIAIRDEIIKSLAIHDYTMFSANMS